MKSNKAIKLFAVLLMINVISSCSKNDSSPGKITLNTDGGAGQFGIPAAIAVADLPAGTLHAYLKINGGNFQEMSISNNTASLVIPDLSTGTTAFAIKWEFNSDSFGVVLLAEGNRDINVVGGNNTLNFTDTDYNTALIDGDNDGISNLDELVANTNPFDATCIFDQSLFDKCNFQS